MAKFRFKVGVGFVFVMVALFTSLYASIVMPQAELARREVAETIRRASDHVKQGEKLRAYVLIDTVRRLAQRREFVEAIVMSAGKGQRIAVFDAISEADRTLKEERGKAALLAVVDRERRIIARDLNINAMADEPFDYPVVRRALAGYAASDVILLKGGMARIAAAPLVAKGRVQGAVVVTYDVAAHEARQQQEQSKAHVVYFMGNRVRASSFRQSNSKEEDAGRVALLNALFFDRNQQHADAQLLKANTVSSLNLLDEHYLAMAGPMPPPVAIEAVPRNTAIVAYENIDDARSLSAIEGKAGWVVLASLDAAMGPIRAVRWRLTFFMGLAVLILLAGMATVARHFVNAEDRLEMGVNEVINGNRDYTFADREEFEGLANALNVMLSELLGRSDPLQAGEDGDWVADGLVFADVQTGSDEAHQALAQEDSERYRRRLYRDFLAARETCGLPTEGIEETAFVRKIIANEAMFRAKLHAEQVRFAVHVEEGIVLLRPIRLRNSG